MTRSSLAALAAAALAAAPALALDPCLFQPFYRSVSFAEAPVGAPANGLVTNHFGWGQIGISTTLPGVEMPFGYPADATVAGPQPGGSTNGGLVAGNHVSGPVYPGFSITIDLPRPVTELGFDFGAPLFSRSNLAAWITVYDAEGNLLGRQFAGTTNQAIGSYPGGGGPPVPITREGRAAYQTFPGLGFTRAVVEFEPEFGFPPNFDDPTTETPRQFQLDNLRWTPEPYCCAADYDGDGHATVVDVFAFFRAWFLNDRARDPRADFNLSGVIEVSDIFAFLRAWFAGCPS